MAMTAYPSYGAILPPTVVAMKRVSKTTAVLVLSLQYCPLNLMQIITVSMMTVVLTGTIVVSKTPNLNAKANETKNHWQISGVSATKANSYSLISLILIRKWCRKVA
eukprot:5916180-Ditylum_brightwellii.AAC.1